MKPLLALVISALALPVVVGLPPATSRAQTVPPQTAINPALTAQQVATYVQEFYDRTHDFDADFVQLSHNRLSGAQDRSDGHVQFLKPGRMRWNYAHPAGNIIVSDGSTMWAYEAGAHQAFQSSLTQSQLPSALSFLTGTGRLANDFTFRLIPASAGWNGYVLELRPIVPNPSFERIVFFVEPAHFQVASTVVFDAQANSNRFDFVNPRVNLSPAQTIFTWTPPAGTQIVRP